MSVVGGGGAGRGSMGTELDPQHGEAENEYK